MRITIIYVLVLLALFGTAMAQTGMNQATTSQKGNLRACDGTEEIDFSKGIPFTPGMILSSPGTMVGTTWYDYQSNGSSGRRIVIDSDGAKHFTWMNGIGYPTPRRIFYNYMSPTGIWAFGDSGDNVSYRVGDGYCQIAVTPDNMAAITYHNASPAGAESLYYAVDSIPGAGQFYYFKPPRSLGALYVSWPYLTVDNAGRIHTVAKTNIGTGASPFGYTRSTNGGGTWTAMQNVDTLKTVSQIVVSSPVSNKVAIVYTHPTDTLYQTKNDVYFIQSSDGLTWNFAGGKVNITHYGLGDSIFAYADVAAAYDFNDNLHIVWNAQYTASNGGMYFGNSRLMHYDMNSGSSRIVQLWQDNLWPLDCAMGNWNFTFAKMSVSSDIRNHIFVTYTSWDSTDCSAGGYANGDIYLQYSSDNGQSWSSSQNLTNSRSDTCLAGYCDSDHWSTLAEHVDSNLYLFYVNDKDAGGIPQTEGIATENPMMFLAVENPLWGVVIDSVFPSSNQLDVIPSTNLSATFRDDMVASSINAGTFLIDGSLSGQHSGAIAYNGPSRTATFNPSSNFVLGEVVTATLTTQVRSLDWGPLKSPYSWSFTIEAYEALAIFDTSNFVVVDSGVYWVVAADFDGDACPDIAGAMTDANKIVVLHNDCGGEFSLVGNYSVGSRPRTIAAADFNNDGRMDLVSANSGSNSISVLLNNGNGTFPPIPSATLLPGGPAWGIASVDFNGDGDLDICATTSVNGTVAIFENNGNGTFPVSPGQVGSTGDGAYGIFVADLNLDFYPDLIVTTGDSLSVKTFTNDGDGGIPPTPSGSYDTEGSSWGLFSANLDGDSYVDLAIANKDQNKLSILLNAGDGTYPSIFGSYDTPGSAWGLFGADLDGDGDIDLAVSSPELGLVTIFLNDGGGNFQLFGSYDTEGSAWGLFAADLNGDGAVDIVVGNSQTDGVTELWNEPLNPGCSYLPGDINGNSFANGIDVVYGVAYLKGGTAPPTNCSPPCVGVPNPFFAAMDVNGNCMANGIDITYFVAYLKAQQPSLLHCAECPPVGRAAPPGPTMMPIKLPITNSKVIE